MCGVNESCEYNRARKNVIIGGAAPLIRITALSRVSPFLIDRAGFGDPPFIFQQTLALFAVVVVEGAFVWLLYGFTRAFSSGMERLVSLVGMGFVVAVMLINLITHFMILPRPNQVGYVVAQQQHPRLPRNEAGQDPNA
jgi:hypothetical protein